MKQVLQRFALMALALSAPFAAQAQASLTGGTYSQTFDTLSNSAGSTTNTALPAGWLMTETGGGTRDNEQYAVDAGGSNTGDTYSYGAAGATDRAFGGLRSGTLVPVFGACFTNGTGSALTSFDVAYTGEQWRVGTTGRGDQLNFEYNIGATSITAAGTWTGVAALNFVGPASTAGGATTGAKDGNAAANRTALSATVSSVSIPSGGAFCVRWTDADASGADDGLSVDDFSLTVAGSPLPSLSIDDVSALEGDSGTTTFTFTLTLSAVAAANVTVNYATASDTATSGVDFTAASGTATITAGQTTTTVTVPVLGDTNLEINETFLVALSGPSANATIADASGTGTITNDDIVITSIGAIQGTGDLSARDGQLVMTEGVVTAKRGTGFFLQSFGSEGNATPDGDAATSDGIYVYTATAPGVVAVGDHVRVAGTVDEFQAVGTALPDTEIVSPSVSVLAPGITLPEPVEITAAIAGPGSEPSGLEHLEGMRVSVANGVITAQTDGRINSEPNATAIDVSSAFEFVVATVPRPLREAGISILDPFPVPPAKQATIPYFDANQERIKAYPLQGTPPVADAGAAVSGLVGNLSYYGDSWELLYDLASPPVIGAASAAAVSNAGADDITVAGFNLLRFFDTVNDPAIGEPVLTSAAFANRLAKTGAAICDWVKAPDILGVVEIENLSTLTELANYINGNCASAPAYTPYLMEGNDPGGIDVGFLVSSRNVRAGVPRVTVSAVTQIGKDTEYAYPAGCTPGVDCTTTGKLNDRPSLVLRAAVNFADGRSHPLTVIANHLRSLNDNDDPTSGRVRYKRAEQALQLANFINNAQTANPSEKIVLVGDFNAFGFNDGYVDSMGIITGDAAPEAEVIEYRASPVATPLVLGDELIADPAQRYSYVFEGNAQTLDHAVVNEALVNDPAVTGLAVEHARINADFREARYDDFSLPYDASNPPLRVSDHDPVRLKITTAPQSNRADIAVSWRKNSATRESAIATLSVRNLGPSAAQRARVLIEAPTGASAVIFTPAGGWSCRRIVATTQYECSSNSALAPGSTHAFSLFALGTRLTSFGSKKFVADASMESVDMVPANNHAELAVP